MVPKTTYSSNHYEYVEPRPVRVDSILEILGPVTPISEDGTELLYHETYPFWVNPENVVTLEDIADLYRYQSGEDFNYTTRSESLSEKWYNHGQSSQDTGFSIPSAWDRNQR